MNRPNRDMTAISLFLIGRYFGPNMAEGVRYFLKWHKEPASIAMVFINESGVKLSAKKHYRQGTLLRFQLFIMSGKPFCDASDL